MPQISIVKLSDIQKAKRFDAEYFKPEYLEIERKLNNQNKTLKDFGVEIFHPNEIKREYVDKDGVLFVRAQNVRPLKFDLTNQSYISKEDAQKLKKNKISKKDILMTRTGANFGQTCLFYENIEAFASSHTFIIKHGQINPYFLSIFLNSKHGRKIIDKGMYGGIQPEISPRYLLEIPFCDFSQTFQRQIENLVKCAHEAQSQSKQLYKHAETMLLEELGLVGYEPQHQRSFETTKRKVKQAKRCDAEYFQPKYDEIIEKIEGYKGGFDIVKNIFNFNNTNFFPKENQLYNYIPLSKVSSTGEIEISEQQELGKHLPTRARRKVKEGDIILSSISGSLETSALIEEHKNCIVSNGFYVFNSQKINSETLLVLFKSKIMIELLQRISKGTILGGYDIITFETLKIPLIHASIQADIAEKVTKSHRLRKQSKDLLNIAKQAVEIAIEQNETAALAYLNKAACMNTCK